mgnify:CR=1 FL=1
MQKNGVKSVYILNDKEAYGLGVATTTRKAAESLGIEIAGFEAWDPKASSYEAQMKKIQGTGADAVFDRVSTPAAVVRGANRASSRSVRPG